MKRKSYGGKSVKLIKTSITLPEVLVRFAEKQVAGAEPGQGYNSFSAYLAELIRRERDRVESPASDPGPKCEITEANRIELNERAKQKSP